MGGIVEARRRILITPGEPAGIGPDLVCMLAQADWPAQLVAVADPAMLERRARQLGIPLDIKAFDAAQERTPHRGGRLAVIETPLAVGERPGRLDPRNADYILQTLRTATHLCDARVADAVVTGPVQKSVINDAGVAFSGHTEFLADCLSASRPDLDHPILPVMMLVAGHLRVALVTTHLPLRAVPDAITTDRLERVLRVLHRDLRARFGLAEPRIAVCGLNPHAGEDGHLGREEQTVIAPVLARLRAEGYSLQGPLPADTAFTPQALEQADAVLAMYHDQGLPVLKHAGFGESVNVTLGLPIIRTSVDHGTALDLAGSGRASAGSLAAALRLAIDLAEASTR